MAYAWLTTYLSCKPQSWKLRAPLETLGPRSQVPPIGSRSMVHSSYRYVTRRFPGDRSRKAPGWYCQGPGSQLLQGPFEDELQAATVVAKTLKLKVADLLRSKVQGPALDERDAVCKYRFVTKRTLRGKTYWVGQPRKGKQRLFTDTVQAAKWTAKQRKMTLKAMLKGSDLHRRQQYQVRLATVVHIYGGGSEVPGDAEYLQQHARSMDAVVEQEPAMEILDVQSKYGPYRTSMVDTSAKVIPRSMGPRMMGPRSWSRSCSKSTIQSRKPSCKLSRTNMARTSCCVRSVSWLCCARLR